MNSSSRQVLISEERIAARVQALGEELTSHYRGRRPVFMGVMNGALFFLTDLIRAVDLETEISCVRLASYAGTTSTGRVTGLEGLQDSVKDREVLIIDDIFDTGATLAALVDKLKRMGAADVRVCVLLEKLRDHVTPIRPDWVGFKIPDAFVVGYGLDYNGRYRGLREIEVLDASVKTEESGLADNAAISLAHAE